MTTPQDLMREVTPSNSEAVEIARLTECLRVAGLQCFMSTGKPEEVANHMASIAKANTDTIDRLTAEVQRLRDERDNAQIAVAMKQDEIVGLSDEVQRLEAKCGRLVAEINAWRSAWRRCDIVAHSDVRKAIDSTISASLNRINGAQLAVDTNNDLSERETNDG